MKIQIKLPANVKRILLALNHSGFESYIVGGCVRDSMLGINPNDWDITTSAKPEETEEVFKHYKMFNQGGLKHGTVTVMIEDTSYEITTYRRDGNYSDCRRPDKVYFTNDIVEDLSRRDFTINSCALDLRGNLIDPFGGKKDLGDKIIRCVGSPERRFGEDALRILRALRFSTKLGFSIEKETQEALVNNRHLLKNVSAERISEEFKKILTSKNFLSVFANMNVLPVIFYILPELEKTLDFEQHSPYHFKDVYGHTIKAMSYASPTVVQRMTLLLHDIAKPQCFSLDKNNIGHFYGHPKESSKIANDILLRLKIDTKTREKITMLVEHHDMELLLSQKYVNKMLNKFGEESLRELIEVKKADILAQSPQFLTERLNDLIEVENMIEQTVQNGNCFSLKNLNINGVDLINLGAKQGKIVGETLKHLLNNVIEEKLENDKGVLRIEAKKYLEKVI